VFAAFSTWFIGVGFAVLMVGLAEIGFQVGRRSAAGGIGAECLCATSVKASVLALVGLLLAFTYSMAAGHYDERVQVVIREAEAIQGCWLRMDLIHDPARARGRELLRSIIDLRLEMMDRATDQAAVRQAAGLVVDDELELWALGASELNQSNEPIKLALLAQSINDVIDRGGESASAADIRVPGPVLCLLMGSMLVAAYLIGFSSGQDQRRVPGLWGLVVVLMALVLTMIFDLDHPGRGWIRDNKKPLEDVKATMR